jgi:hypothetical protein
VNNGESPIVPEFDIMEQIDGKLTFSMHLDYTSEHLAHSINNLDFDTNTWFVMSFHWTKNFCEWYVNGFLVKKFGLNLESYNPKPHWFIFSDAYKRNIESLTGKDGMKIDWILITDENVKFNF